MDYPSKIKDKFEIDEGTEGSHWIIMDDGGQEITIGRRVLLDRRIIKVSIQNYSFRVRPSVFVYPVSIYFP